LVQVPPAIPRLPHLKRLNLSFNCLREDPAYLASLSTDLVLAGNRFNDMTRDCTAYLRVREGDGAGY